MQRFFPDMKLSSAECVAAQLGLGTLAAQVACGLRAWSADQALRARLHEAARRFEYLRTCKWYEWDEDEFFRLEDEIHMLDTALGRPQQRPDVLAFCEAQAAKGRE